MKIDKEYCMSSYLAFRFVPEKNVGWSEEYIPKYPEVEQENIIPIENAQDISNYLKTFTKQNVNAGLLLSGGIDSAIIASYCPKGTKAYSIRFNSDGAIDETIMAQKYADYYGLDLKIVEVYWEDYVNLTPILIRNKKSGLHVVEVALYKAAATARKDGINKLYCGNGADSNFGGMSKLLQKDWDFEEFVQRYTYIMPQSILKNPGSIINTYEKFKLEDGKIDFISFLRNVHGIGIIQAFTNALSLAGCTALEPYENMLLKRPLDLFRIRSGEPKYLLRRLFSKRYPNFEIPHKIPFVRPMDKWLKDYKIPERKEFINNIDNKVNLDGEQKWLIYCLSILLDNL
ncbi:MAG: asparagine synthase C-terminal domain-containing protein [Endomicrobium sp.]|jgi:hypothetical protein|uniref:asparagine synthase-related protein n=1 Tax=Candidatus Endomicrobiellum cubanum TaxID=3242325 RepID=UPI002832D534|nr:asparagine synthase C-terminal domain-containing protein [Endomicrobium sp.]